MLAASSPMFLQVCGHGLAQAEYTLPTGHWIAASRSDLDFETGPSPAELNLGKNQRRRMS